MDQIQAQIFAVLQNVLLTLITVLGGLAVRYIQQHFTAKQIDNAKAIAQIAASSMQEIGKAIGLTGPEKLASAISTAQEFGSKAGIKLTAEQWDRLIHDALAALKDIWNTAVESKPVTSAIENAPVIDAVSNAAQTEPVPVVQMVGR